MEEIDTMENTQKQFMNPSGLATPRGYTHVVTAQPGRLVFIAGQVAYDATGQLVGAGDLRAQAEQVYENLKTALAAAGATFADVVKFTTFVVGYKHEDRAIIAEVRSRYVSAERLPASALVGVQALALPGLLIEVEATAVVA
jgi:enamine deaminase RidA (YjgF/YER057c/UK114 family)